jgi:hypothetical protein
MMEDQDQKVMVGHWRILSGLVLGKLLITQGLNNSLVAKLKFNGNFENMTAVKL